MEHQTKITDHIRRPGGGRKPIKKIPGVIARIEELMKYETAGDPSNGLKRTRKTTRKIADELSYSGIKASRFTVGKIMRKTGFSLKTNRKVISNGGKSASKKEKKTQRAIYLQ